MPLYVIQIIVLMTNKNDDTEWMFFFSVFICYSNFFRSSCSCFKQLIYFLSSCLISFFLLGSFNFVQLRKFFIILSNHCCTREKLLYLLNLQGTLHLIYSKKEQQVLILHPFCFATCHLPQFFEPVNPIIWFDGTSSSSKLIF